MNVDDLYAALAGIPPLPGARCKGRSDIWDSCDDPELVEYAIQQCRSCESLTACQQWFGTLKPSQRPHSCVIAGKVIPVPRQRNRQQQAS